MKLDVDLLSGVATPEALLVWPVAISLDRYCLVFRGLVERNGSDASFVRTAALSVEFDISISRPYSGATPDGVALHVCRNDRGRPREDLQE